MISGEVILLIVVTLINISLWIIFFFRLKRTFSTQTLLNDIKNEVDKLLIEINKTTLDDITLIEERRIGLQNLLDETDKRLLLLQGQEKDKIREKEVLQRLSKKNATVYPDQKAVKAYQNMSKAVETPDHSEAVQLSIDFDSYREEALQTQEPVLQEEVVTLPEIIHVEGSFTNEVPFKQKVLELDEKDFSIDYIANTLGRTITEVQFILDLYKNNS